LNCLALASHRGRYGLSQVGEKAEDVLLWSL
jgi:hypothetical protein